MRGIVASVVVTTLLVGSWLLLSAESSGGIDDGPTAKIAEDVRSVYVGEIALETVAFLDNYVRWPGNTGFDAAIDHLVERLIAAGFVLESVADASDRLTYRVEEYPLSTPAWEPVAATLLIEGQTVPVLELVTNRNMLATRSFSTPPDGVTAELIYVGSGSESELNAVDVEGKIVMADGSLSGLFRSAVQNRGAIGVLAYSLPGYLKPQVNKHSIQFRRIVMDEKAASWGIALSTDARDKLQAALDRGPVRVTVKTDVKWTRDAVERTVVADVKGSEVLDERFVFSAHVQEPGANDNASGVGSQMEMARTAAVLIQQRRIDPGRSITFLWGDEIRSTRRYISQDPVRATGILWGMSLDMVGEDTEKTGGTFLIEKMPDPSAIWTRGEDKHSEWGGRPLTKADMTPHYFNDLVLGRALEQASTNGWVVKTNPYEGGSDHVPFLSAGIPGLLLWHFTDQYYHTDRDRIEMVSAWELKNVGVTALVTAIALTDADEEMALGFVQELLDAALSRLEIETRLSLAATSNGGAVSVEQDILTTWADWYDKSLESAADIQVGGSSAKVVQAIAAARLKLSLYLADHLTRLS